MTRRYKVAMRIGVGAMYAILWSLILFRTPGLSILAKLGCGAIASVAVAELVWIRLESFRNAMGIHRQDDAGHK